ncbi:accessory gene regulator B family protein [Bacillus cereus]|nr:accessory gene regulator B family protein [Bacillus cereus]
MKNWSPNKISVALSDLVVKEIPQYYSVKDEIRYGFEWMLAMVFQIFFIVALASIFHVIRESLYCLIVGCTLRIIGGGAHFKSYFKCAIYSTGLILLIVLSTVHYLSLSKNILMIMALFSIIVFALYAPVLHKTKHLFTDKKKLTFKLLSLMLIMVIIFLTFIFKVFDEKTTMIIWFAVFFQALSLSKTFNFLIAWFDEKTTPKKER